MNTLRINCWVTSRMKEKKSKGEEQKTRPQARRCWVCRRDHRRRKNKRIDRYERKGDTVQQKPQKHMYYSSYKRMRVSIFDGGTKIGTLSSRCLRRPPLREKVCCLFLSFFGFFTKNNAAIISTGGITAINADKLTTHLQISCCASS